MAIREEFLNGKLVLIGEENLHISKELFVNFCTPNVFSGGDILKDLHDIAGPSLHAECRRFSGLGSGGCRITDSFEASQFKKIAHCILPAPKPVERQDEIDYFDFALAYRNALDMGVESGCKSLVFTHPQFYSHKLIASIAVATIKRWLNIVEHSNEVDEICIMCGSHDIFQLYVDTISGDRNPDDLMDEVFCDVAVHSAEELPECGGPVNIKLFENLMQAPEFDASLDNTFGYQNNGQCPTTNQYCMEKYGFDENYIRQNSERLYDELFKTPDGLQLQLSRNLSATILTIEEENGYLRQYRMTTHNREGDTCYFRCSRCESLMKQTNSEYRPKITVKAGFIFGDCYPEHHPQCEPLTKEMIIFQQMDREARLGMMKPIPGVDYPEYPDYLAPKQEVYSNGYYQENMMPDYLPPYKQDNGFARPKIRGFVDSAGYFYENPIPTAKPLSNANNTLQAIRKCETELDEDYFGAGNGGGGIRDEEFSRAMVGDLEHQEEFDGQVNNENELRRDLNPTSISQKALINDLPEGVVPDESGDYNNAATKILNESELVEPMEEDPAIMEDDYHFPRITNTRLAGYRLPSYAPEPDEYIGGELVDTDDAGVGGEAQLGVKCRKYRIIRERRRTNVAFDWRDESRDIKPDVAELSAAVGDASTSAKMGGARIATRSVAAAKAKRLDDAHMRMGDDELAKFVYEDDLEEFLDDPPTRHSLRR